MCIFSFLLLHSWFYAYCLFFVDLLIVLHDVWFLHLQHQNYDIVLCSFSAFTLLVRWQEGRLACYKSWYSYSVVHFWGAGPSLTWSNPQKGQFNEKKIKSNSSCSTSSFYSLTSNWHLFSEKCRLSQDSAVCSIKCRHRWTLQKIETAKWFCIYFILLCLNFVILFWTHRCTLCVRWATCYLFCHTRGFYDSAYMCDVKKCTILHMQFWLFNNCTVCFYCSMYLCQLLLVLLYQ